MGIYERLVVRTRINAAGLLTRLGGSLMPPEVVQAMVEASQHFVDIAELQARASETIVRCTGADAGLVTSGAAAALTLGTAACLTGLDAARMDRLPDTADFPNEVLMARTHRTAYDHAIRAAGVRIVDVGLNDRGTGAGVRGVEAWEWEAAISPRTAAIAYTAGPDADPPLTEVVAVAAMHNIPVLVDAAAQLPPADNLRRFITEGASLVAFSGGKALRGPQASGILCGRKDLIAAAALQQLDMDVEPATWAPPSPFIPRERVKGVPHHGLGRGLKVGKEEITGLVAALERYVALDHAAELKALNAQVEHIAEQLKGLPHVAVSLRAQRADGRPYLLDICLDEAALGKSAADVSSALQQHEPPINLHEGRMRESILTVNPVGLKPGEEKIVADALRSELAR